MGNSVSLYKFSLTYTYVCVRVKLPWTKYNIKKEVLGILRICSHQIREIIYLYLSPFITCGYGFTDNNSFMFLFNTHTLWVKDGLYMLHRIIDLVIATNLYNRLSSLFVKQRSQSHSNFKCCSSTSTSIHCGE